MAMSANANEHRFAVLFHMERIACVIFDLSGACWMEVMLGHVVPSPNAKNDSTDAFVAQCATKHKVCTRFLKDCMSSFIYKTDHYYPFEYSLCKTA